MTNREGSLDWRKFNHPKIVFAEKTIVAGESDTIQQHELKVSRDMVVDYLAISDNTFTEQAYPLTAANQTFLHWISVNWSVVERARWVPIGFGTIEEFHNFFEGDRFNWPITVIGDPTTLQSWGAMRWRHSEPWVYNPIDTVSIDIAAPPAPAALNVARDLNVFMDGVGLKTGLRRLFRIPDSAIPGQAVGVPFSQSFSQPQLMANLGDEAFKMQAVGVACVGRYWNTVAPGPVDVRLLNFYRMRMTPSIGDGWSDTPVPLVFYGIHQGPAWRLAVHKPAGGPIFLYAGQSIVFNIQNNATAANTGLADPVDIDVQVALIGRTAPGIGSLV